MHPSVYKRPLLWVVIAVVIGLSLFYRPAISPQDVSRFLPQKEITLTGQVVSFPVTRKDKQNVFIDVLSVNGQKVTGRVYARIGNFLPRWKDTLQLSGRLQKPYGVDLPGNFDWRAYLASKHTFAEIKTSQVSLVKKAAWFWRIIRDVRQKILTEFSTSFPPQIAGIAGGILLGERGDFPADLYTAFQQSGAIHLLVASGGNVGFVTLLTLAVGFALGFSRRPLLILSLVTAGIYTLVAGADAPLLRAYLMTLCACVGYFLGRNSGVFQGLLLACLIILGLTPSAVFDTGFQMSFLATLAIVVCLNNYRVPTTWPKTARFFAQIFLATLSCQLVLLPIFTNVFYSVSLMGLVSNMLLVPFASVLMALGFAYALLAFLHVGIILYYPCLWGFEIFQTLVEFFASFSLSSISATAWNAGSIIAYYTGLFWVSQLPHKTFAKRLFVPCIFIMLVAFFGGQWYQNRPTAYLISEWNNHAAIVRVNAKTTLVFNAGITPEKLQQALAALGVSHATLTLPVRSPDLFEEVWPGDTFSLPGITVRAIWALKQTQDGRVYEETGYAGQKEESVSYCIETNAQEICIGAHARFLVLPGGKTVSFVPNAPVKVRW